MSGSFPALPQIQPFQAPNLIAMSNAMQERSTNAMRESALMGAEKENMDLRRLMADPNFDPTAPGSVNRILAVAPRTGAQTVQALMAAQNQRRQAEGAEIDRRTKLIEKYRNLLPGTNAETYPILRDQILRDIPDYAAILPRSYSPEGVADVIQKADDFLKEWDTVIIEGVPFRRNQRRGVLRPYTEEPASGAPPAAAGGTVTPLSGPAPAAAASDAIPLSQRVDPAAVLPAIDRAEGRGANQASSARGQFQFIDNTFVDEFKANFPDIARGLTKEQILEYRNSTLPDGRPIEQFLGEAHTNRNARELEKSGFEPNGANLYLAHFAGLGGARSLLRADANTPVERVLSEDAIKSNPFLRGKTVGQIRQWSADSVDYGPGQARRRLLAMGAPDNTPAPDAALTSPVLRSPLAEDGAPPVANAMVTSAAVPVANAMVSPAVGSGAPPPVTLASDMRPAGPGLPQNVGQAFDRARMRREEDALATARAARRAESEKENEGAVRSLDSALDVIERVTRPQGTSGRNLLDMATGSGLGSIRDMVYDFIGKDTPEATAAERLETAHAQIASMLPKPKGDLSKVEVDLMKAQAAKLGNRSLPNAARQAALVDLLEQLVSTRQRLTGERVGPPTRAQQPSAAPAAPAGGGWSIRPVQ